MTLLTLPPYSCSRLSPGPPERVTLLFHLFITIRLDITGIACRPLGELCRLPRTLCASDVSTLLANGSSGRDELGLALVARASDALCGRLVCQLVTRSRGDGEDLLPLGLVGGVLCLQLLFWGLLPRVPRTLLAPLVVAVQAHLVRAIEGAAHVAAAVHSHADGLLDTLHRGYGAGRSNPFMGLEGEAVLGEERAGAFLLHGAAVEHFGDWGGSDQCSGIILIGRWWSRGTGALSC